MFSYIRNHPIGVGTGAAVLIAGLAWLAFGFFGVHTLFIDDVVDEAGPVFDAQPVAMETDADIDPSPSSSPADSSDTDSSDTAPPIEPEPESETETETPASEIVTELTGTFQGDAHPTAGTARI